MTVISKNPILKDKTLIDKFLTRGVENIFPTKDALREKLMSGQKLRVYQGFDPTGPHLHVGHAIGIRALRILQQLGHEVIFLVGDFTSKVGDPDKEKARKMLTDSEIEQNMAGWKEQASQIIDFSGENPVLFKRNYEWLSKLNLADLIKLMSSATVQQMIERDMFARRIEENDPIGLQEFIYPLMQGFDNVAMEVDLEIGGTDQTFNMLMGRSLVKQYLNKEKFVRTNIMMDAPDGRTMSKTKGNGINLADTPENMFGKAMSYNDELITKGLRLLTDIELEEIDQIDLEIKKGDNPMKYKKMMAFEIVKILKGNDRAVKAQQHFESTVQNKVQSEEFAKVTNVTGVMTVLDFFKQVLDTNTSGAQIKRVIEQGGVEINGEKVDKPFEEINFEKGTMIKFGKRDLYKIN